MYPLLPNLSLAIINLARGRFFWGFGRGRHVFLTGWNGVSRLLLGEPRVGTASWEHFTKGFAMKLLRMRNVLAVVVPLVVTGFGQAADKPTTQQGAFQGLQAGQARDDNSLKMKFAWCPPGEFTMGSADGDKDDKPKHYGDIRRTHGRIKEAVETETTSKIGQSHENDHIRHFCCRRCCTAVDKFVRRGQLASPRNREQQLV